MKALIIVDMLEDFVDGALANPRAGAIVIAEPGRRRRSFRKMPAPGDGCTSRPAPARYTRLRALPVASRSDITL